MWITEKQQIKKNPKNLKRRKKNCTDTSSEKLRKLHWRWSRHGLEGKNWWEKINRFWLSKHLAWFDFRAYQPV